MKLKFHNYNLIWKIKEKCIKLNKINEKRVLETTMKIRFQNIVQKRNNKSKY